jgi:hypothetical protein
MAGVIKAAHALVEGRATRLRPIDWTTSELGRQVTIEPQPNLVIEGIAALHPNIGARADLYLG